MPSFGRPPFALRRGPPVAPSSELWELVLNAVGDAALGARIDEGGSGEELVLVRRMARGDPDASEQFYRRHSQSVFRFVYRRIGESFEDAEEVTLDTFLSAMDMAPTFGGRSSVFVWLCGIAKLRLIDFHRRQSSSKRPSQHAQAALDEIDEILLEPGRSPGEAVDALLERMLASQVMDAALSRLNDDEREALLLRYVEGLSTREIAQLMKRTERAVESLVLRAKAKPRDFLMRALGEEVRP